MLPTALPPRPVGPSLGETGGRSQVAERGVRQEDSSLGSSAGEHREQHLCSHREGAFLHGRGSAEGSLVRPLCPPL